MNIKKRFVALLLCLMMVLSCTVCTACAEQAMPEPSGDENAAPAAPAAEELAAAMLADMDTRQKIGQMLMPAFDNWTDEKGVTKKVTALNEPIADAIKDLGFGGVMLFADNCAGTAATASLVCDMQQAATAPDSLSGIPLLISADQEGGYIYRLSTGTAMPGNMALGAVGDPALTRQAAAVIGSELAAEGVNLDFAPVMDVNNDPSNPVIGIRSFSDDPDLVASMGAAFIEGLHSANVATALKHFPGHGDTGTDSHSGLPSINKNREQLTGFELVPFKAGIDAGTDMIMTAHIQYPLVEAGTYVSKSSGEEITLPATLSHTIITGLLRNELGFNGVVCTDALNMGAISTHFDPLDAAKLAINAGVDILLMPVTMADQKGVAACKKYIDSIVEMADREDGGIDIKTVDAAVLRILTLKYKLGLMDRTFDKETQVAEALAAVGSRDNHETEWAITSAGITLVKNDGDFLPVKVPKNGKVALFCAYSNEVKSMEYAFARLKDEGIVPESAACSVFCYNGKSAAEYASAVGSADVILASVETGSRAAMDPASSSGWQAAFLDGLIDMVHQSGKKIGVISIKLPYDLARYQKADALLAAYCCKGMDEMPLTFNGETKSYGPNLPAAVYMALGGAAPTASLPVDIPALDSAYKYTDNILYQRGFGLYYAENEAHRGAEWMEAHE